MARNLWSGLKQVGALAVLTFMVMLCACSSLAQERGAMRITTDRPPLQVDLSFRSRALKTGDALVLDVMLINVSSERLSVFGQLLWGYGGGLTLHVQDRDGQPIAAEQLDDDLLAPSVLGDQATYVVLMPNHFLGTIRTDSVRNLFRNPGTYTVFVEYHSPVPSRYAKTPNFWGREKSPLRSTAVRIEVTGP